MCECVYGSVRVCVSVYVGVHMLVHACVRRVKWPSG